MIYCVYCIKHITDENIFYIGSTTNYNNRVKQHFSNFKHQQTKLHRMISEHGGLDNFTFDIIETYEGIEKHELRQHENKFIIDMKPCLNSRMAYMSDEQKKKYSAIRGLRFRGKKPDYHKNYYLKKKNDIKTIRYNKI